MRGARGDTGHMTTKHCQGGVLNKKYAFPEPSGLLRVMTIASAVGCPPLYPALLPCMLLAMEPRLAFVKPLPFFNYTNGFFLFFSPISAETAYIESCACDLIAHRVIATNMWGSRGGGRWGTVRVREKHMS